MSNNESKARIDRKHRVIIISTPWGPYYINLNECQTPEQIEEWKQHLSIKNWGPGIMADFLRLAIGVNNE